MKSLHCWLLNYTKYSIQAHDQQNSTLSITPEVKLKEQKKMALIAETMGET
jgi:hypothetical protein